MPYTVQGRELETDNEGYLLEPDYSDEVVPVIAAAEGISWHTARTHLKNVMRKTGCHRQLELFALLQSLSGG